MTGKGRKGFTEEVKTKLLLKCEQEFPDNQWVQASLLCSGEQASDSSKHRGMESLLEHGALGLTPRSD